MAAKRAAELGGLGGRRRRRRGGGCPARRVADRVGVGAVELREAVADDPRAMAVVVLGGACRLALEGRGRRDGSTMAIER